MPGEDASSPRSAPRLLIDTFHLYRRYPLLFFVLAAAVIVPYALIVLVAGGSGRSSVGIGLSLTLIQVVLVTPLVSALHVHAVAEAREGGNPRLVPIAAQGLRVLPVVAAASVAAGLGIGVGFLLFLIPGVILLLRWAVVAQTAAIEHEGWLSALRRSGLLTEGHYWHVFFFFVCVSLIVVPPDFLLSLAFGEDAPGAGPVLVGMLVQIVTASFGALAGALLYYDLRVRSGTAGVPTLAADGGPSTNQSWDPRHHTDEDRPNGWYVDIESPGRMRYWGASESPGWSGATTKTPRKIRRAWEELAAEDR